MAHKATLSPLEQKEFFARAFETYKHYIDTQNFIGAYVIAFSILEDRISAMYMTRFIIDQGVYPTEINLRTTPFKKKVDYLHKFGDISDIEHDDWLLRAHERNSKVHAAMWNIDEFKLGDTETLVASARKADNLRGRQKQKFGK